jgi:hypothetical protein
MPTTRHPIHRKATRRINDDAIRAWKNADYMPLHIALDLAPWQSSPLPTEVTVLGIDEDDIDPADRENYKSNLKILQLQKELLALCGWPDCRHIYEQELADAESYVTHCQDLVDHPGRGGQGTGCDPEIRRQALEQAQAKVEYRRRLLDELDETRRKWAP